MKKVLLTTTALVLTAGVASAEYSITGKAEAGFYRTGAVKAADAPTKGCFDVVDGAITFDADKLTSACTEDEADDVQDALKRFNEATTVSGATDARLDKEAAELNVARQKATAEAKAGELTAYSGYDFNVALSGASDNGMTFAMGFDLGAGHIADQDDDRAMDAQSGEIAADEMTIGYMGYTVKIGNDLIDDTYDNTQNGDVSLSGSLGDLTFSIVHDMDDDVKQSYASKNATTGAYVAGTAAVYNPTSYSLGYTMGDISFSMAGTEHDDRGNAAAKMALGYTISDALSVKLESDNLGTYKDVAKVSATYKMSDMLSLTASVKDDKAHALNTNTGGRQSSDLSIAYSAGALAATIATDESSNWWVNAQYDLGGGAQAFTTFDHTEFLVAGVNFSF